MLPSFLLPSLVPGQNPDHGKVEEIGGGEKIERGKEAQRQLPVSWSREHPPVMMMMMMVVMTMTTTTTTTTMMMMMVVVVMMTMTMMI